MKTRINKYVRDMGWASRREADALITQGSVFINGERAKLGDMVSETDTVTLKGKTKEYKYLAYYKPRGLATQSLGTTESVINIFAKDKIYPIGRLDKESEGLMILTNDGRLTPKVLSQSKKFGKEYIVKVKEKLRSGLKDIFAKGMETKSLGRLLPAEIKLMGDNLISIILHEGKRHQIRIMLSELGYTVSSLRRVRIGKINSKGLSAGETRPLTPLEVKELLG